MTGASRVNQQAREEVSEVTQKQDHERKLRQIESKRKEIDAQIAQLKAEVDFQTAELDYVVAQENLRAETSRKNSETLARQRGSRGKKSSPKETR